MLKSRKRLVIILSIIAAIFVLVYFVMKRVDRDLDANDSGAKGSPVLRKDRNDSFVDKREK